MTRDPDAADTALDASLPRGGRRATADDSIVVAQPIGVVFDYIADARHQREWNPVCKDMRQISAGPIGTGTTFVGQFKKVGRMAVEIIAYERPHLLVHRGHPWMAEVGHVWRLTTVDGGTRLDQHGVMCPTRWGRLMAPLMPLIVRKNVQDTSHALEAAFKNAAVPPPA